MGVLPTATSFARFKETWSVETEVTKYPSAKCWSVTGN